MAVVRVGFYALEKLKVRHFLAGRDDGVAFIEATGDGAVLTFAGTVDELRSFSAVVAECVDNADKAIAAAKGEPLPMDVNA